MFEQEYIQAVSRLTLPEEKANQIRKLTLTKRQSGFSRLRLAPIAAAALLLTACAAVFFDPAAMLGNIFGLNGRASYEPDTVARLYEPGGGRTELDEELAKRYIEPCVQRLEGTLTDGNTTLTALSMIVDRFSCAAAVYLKLENPPAYTVYNSGWILFQEHENGWYIHPKAIGQSDMIGRCFIDEKSTTDQTLYCTLMFSLEPQSRTLELRLGDQTEAIIIPLPEKTDMPAILLEEGDIALTPFGMSVKTSVLRQGDDDSRRVTPRPKRELAIQFEDGSEYLLLHLNYGDEDYNGCTYVMALNPDLESYVLVFNRVVDTDKVSALRINDRIYPVT